MESVKWGSVDKGSPSNLVSMPMQGNDGPEGVEGRGKRSWGRTRLVSCG